MLIKNGYIIDPASGRAEFADLQISDGKIFSIGQHLSVSPSEEIIDASGLTIAPGLIDTHVHFRDPGFTYKEDIHTGASASAAGGFTSVICMANTSPVVDSVSVFSGLAAREKEEAIHIYQAAAVSHDLKGTELTDMKALAAAGACGFTDDGIPLKDAAFLLKAMELAAQLNLPISLHEEDPSFIEINGINHGAASDFLGIYGSPSIAEESLVARDCMLALKSGADVVIQHISSGNSVELVRLAKKLGADVHAEATPHHFTLTEDAVLTYGTMARMNPPVREEADRLKIIEGIQDGTIDMIVTDHAPHSAEEKARPMAQAPSGITGLETSLALGIRSLVQPGYITLMELMELMSKNPMEFYRMTPGSIQAGAPADIVIFGENEEWVVEHFHSKASNSPFLGWTLPGKLHYTICNGKIVAEN